MDPTDVAPDLSARSCCAPSLCRFPRPLAAPIAELSTPAVVALRRRHACELRAPTRPAPPPPPPPPPTTPPSKSDGCRKGGRRGPEHRQKLLGAGWRGRSLRARCCLYRTGLWVWVWVWVGDPLPPQQLPRAGRHAPGKREPFFASFCCVDVGCGIDPSCSCVIGPKPLALVGLAPRFAGHHRGAGYGATGS